MSQNDFVISNQTFPATRADLTDAFQAASSNSSGSVAPTTTYANMTWYDTGNNTLKLRSEANDAWISIGYLDQSTDAFRVFDDTEVVNTSGTQTGLIGDQLTTTWEGGTGTLQSLVSPANIKSAIESLVPSVASPIGVNQTWSTVTRTRGTVYQNTSGGAVQINVALSVYTYTSGGGDATYGDADLQVSADNSTWFTLGSINSGYDRNAFFSPIIPDDYFYKWTGSSDTGFPSTVLSEAEFTLLS